mmetsp:Transcript_51148/g.121560  ORF Transcript_51148/g.121560 Transcript_51148/m.121560 type:complete len:534 (+) Transcript_51148:82-1683(+)
MGKDKDKAEKRQPINVEPPSGTRDFFPEDMRFRNWLFEKMRYVGKIYGFQEYDAPVLEHDELFKRKQGEEITEQMYCFTDKEGAHVTLRPEMTPSFARMVLSLMRAETGEMAALLPLKWFSIPQCWRFETTQRGRKREHYQWNMDIVGIPGIQAEVEILSAAVMLFESVGLTAKEIVIRVNSRKLLATLLKKAGVPDDKFASTCVIVDKLDKMPAEEVIKELNEKEGLAKEVGATIVKATSAKTIAEFAEIANVGKEDTEELQRLFDLADEYGFGDWLQFDASVVRGLAYYTGVVFEGVDRGGVIKTMVGGGRYDKLLSLFGSPKEVPCAGFGFGDIRLYEVLKEYGKLPELSAEVEFVVAAYSSDMFGKALAVARKLRLAGKTVDVYPDQAKKVAKAFNFADRVGAKKIAFVAPDEYSRGLVRIKDLRSFTADTPDEEKQKDVPLDDLANVDAYFGGKAATTGDSATASSSKGGEFEALLQDQPYIGGFRPSAEDCSTFEKLRGSSGKPKSAAMARWYEHMESFTQAERSSW